MAASRAACAVAALVALAEARARSSRAEVLRRDRSGCLSWKSTPSLRTLPPSIQMSGLIGQVRVVNGTDVRLCGESSPSPASGVQLAKVGPVGIAARSVYAPTVGAVQGG